MRIYQKKPKDIESLTQIFRTNLFEVAKRLKNKDVKDITRNEFYRSTIVYDIRPRLNKRELELLGGYKVIKEQVLNTEEGFISKDESNTQDKNSIIRSFKKYLEINGVVPSIHEFSKHIQKEARFIKKFFSNIKELLEETRDSYPNVDDYIFNEDYFTLEYFDNLQEEIKKYKRFIITTAVSGKKVHLLFLKSLKNYAKKNEALILVMPCQDVASRKSTYEWNIDPELKECSRVIFKDTYLNDNLFLCDIKTSAKMLYPTTGLDRLVPSKGSIIIGGTKRFLRFIPNTNNKQSRCIMTTGACTVSDYNTDLFMSLRLSKLAEHDHLIGGVVVEIEDDETFYFRQIEASTTGSIVDLGVEYSPDNTINFIEDTVAILGDIHNGKQDEEADRTIRRILIEQNIQDVVLHDVFDCNSVNHHHNKKYVYCANKFNLGRSSLYNECKDLAGYLDDLSTYIGGKIIIVKSNHDEALERYLEEGRFLEDKENLKFASKCLIQYADGEDPLKHAVEQEIGLREDTEIIWLKRDEEYSVYNTELGCHGDLGANGGRGRSQTFENAYNNSVIGHRHSPSIHRSVFTVGASSLNMEYNRGLSSWVISLCLLYKNGARQLINLIKTKNGTYSYSTY